MKSRGNKKFFGITIASIVLFASIYFLGIIVFGTNSYSFSLDPILSEQTHEIVKNTVYESYFLSLHAIADSIQKACPAVDAVFAARCADKVLRISCKACKPYIRFSNQKLVSKNGKEIDWNYFTDATRKHLPLITLTPKENPKVVISSAFKSWLLKLNPDLLSRYEIKWCDDYQIYLINKADFQKRIICSIDTQIDQKLEGKCQQLFTIKGFCAQGTARENYCFADIRFEKQIIIFSQKGGALYG